MGRAISVPQRQVIFERAGFGYQAEVIADDLGLNPDTVRRLIARFGQAGAAGITPITPGAVPTSRVGLMPT